MGTTNEIRLGRRWGMSVAMVQALAALTFLVILWILSGCSDGEFERQQRIAEFNQRFVNAALPAEGESRTCKWVAEHLICYPSGKKRQPIVVSARDEVPQ